MPAAAEAFLRCWIHKTLDAFEGLMQSQPCVVIFVPTDLVAAIRSVDIAPFDGWVTPGATRSDHAPVAVEIDLA